MKKEMQSKTTDVWTPEPDEVSPIASIILVVSGNGTKLSSCVINFVPTGDGEWRDEPGFMISDIAKMKELISQLNIVASQWDDRLGNSKRR